MGPLDDNPLSFSDKNFQEYLAQRAKLFDPTKATPFDRVGSCPGFSHCY